MIGCMLLPAAVLRCSCKLTIGVTDGPCSTRIEKLHQFLNDIDPRIEYSIVPVTDPFGPTAHDPDLKVNTKEFVSKSQIAVIELYVLD